jgi:hypothetical protein
MKAFGKLFVTVALGLTAFAVAASAQTGPRSPVIMIAGDDAAEDAVLRGTATFDHMQHTIAEHLRIRGYKVFEEEDVTSRPGSPPNRTRRQTPELIDVAKLAKVPVDVIVVIQVHVVVRPVGQVRDLFRPSIRVDARYLTVRDGQPLGNYTFGDDIDLPPIPGHCANDKPCLLQHLGPPAELMAQAMGHGLAVKLAALLPDGGAAVYTPPEPR